MPNPLLKNRKLIYTLFVSQLIAVTLCSILWLIFRGPPAFAYSLLGGSCWLLPSLFFTSRTARLLKPRLSGIFNPSAALMSFYIGEFGKFFISFLLILLSIYFLPVIIFPFLSGYVSAVVAIFTLPIYLILAKNNN